MQQRNSDSQRFTFDSRSKAVLVTGFIVLSLLAIPWFNLPYSGMNWVAAGQPYEPTHTPVATGTSIVTRTPTRTVATTTPTVTLTPATPETHAAYLALVRRDPPPPPTPTPTPWPTATPTITPIPMPADGQWQGNTSTQGGIFFEVYSGGTRWKRFFLSLTGTCIQDVAFGLEGRITNNRFGYTSDTLSFSGRFTSDMTASGDYVVSNDPPFCSESGTWTATCVWDCSKPTLTPTPATNVRFSEVFVFQAAENLNCLPVIWRPFGEEIEAAICVTDEWLGQQQDRYYCEELYDPWLTIWACVPADATTMAIDNQELSCLPVMLRLDDGEHDVAVCVTDDWLGTRQNDYICEESYDPELTMWTCVAPDAQSALPMLKNKLRVTRSTLSSKR